MSKNSLIKNKFLTPAFRGNSLKFGNILKIANFSTLTTSGQSVAQTTPKRTHGGLKDSDRIFTNVYRDGDPFIEGSLKRVL
jgi:hypothetical protein